MRIAVIGAGAIGATAALALARDGHTVTLMDRAGVAAGASGGNAGAFAFSDVIPLATPGILRKAPRWLIDPLGPLSIPPRHALRILPWLLRFWRASLPDRYAAAVAAQSALMRLSRTALERLVARHRLDDLLRREGQLQVYDGRTAFDAARPGLEERRAAGVQVETLEDAGALAEIQPGLAERFTHGAYVPDWINVTDPRLWVERLVAAFAEAGGKMALREVRALRPGPDGVSAECDGARLLFDRVVIAAGAHSRRLLRTIGVGVPLETERGYNTTLPAGAFDLRTHLTFADHGFVVTRIGDGIRVGGAVELGGLDLPPNMARARALLERAAEFLPGLRTDGGTEWMGFRPSMPDSLPVIDIAPGEPRVVLALGHGHLGLTQSAGTAELIAALVARTPPAVDLAPYRATRFGWG